eukprot:scaffold38811_cov63-Phaeocystis_antarctica.AAC.2
MPCCSSAAVGRFRLQPFVDVAVHALEAWPPPLRNELAELLLLDVRLQVEVVDTGEEARGFRAAQPPHHHGRRVDVRPLPPLPVEPAWYCTHLISLGRLTRSVHFGRDVWRCAGVASARLVNVLVDAFHERVAEVAQLRTHHGRRPCGALAGEQPGDQHVVDLEVTVAHVALVQLRHAAQHAVEHSAQKRALVLGRGAPEAVLQVLRQWPKQWEVQLARWAVIPKQLHNVGHAL